MELPRAEPQWDRHPPSHLPQAAKSALRETSPSYALGSSPTPSPFSHSDNSTLTSAPRPGSVWEGLPHSSVLCLKKSPKFTHNHMHANKHVDSPTPYAYMLTDMHLSTCVQVHSPHVRVCMLMHMHTHPHLKEVTAQMPQKSSRSQARSGIGRPCKERQKRP